MQGVLCQEMAIYLCIFEVFLLWIGYIFGGVSLIHTQTPELTEQVALIGFFTSISLNLVPTIRVYFVNYTYYYF